MRSSIVALLALTATASCYATEFSAELQESGTVQQITYNPGGVAQGVGVDLTGKGGVSVVSTTIPDRYAIAFRCKHGVFTLRPTGENAKRIFERGFQPGDSVTLIYREEYHIADGRRELAKLDFLDAVKR